MGQVLTLYAMRDARAARQGARHRAPWALRNSNHFGTALYYTLDAARRGLRRLPVDQCQSRHGAVGRPQEDGRHQSVVVGGTGGLALRPMVLDIANTGVARGKIYLAKQKGVPIPEGWAIDAEGAPTTDAAAAIDGIILPMAGHKGYAIAAMMDMLSGVLTGSAFGTGAASVPTRPSTRAAPAR